MEHDLSSVVFASFTDAADAQVAIKALTEAGEPLGDITAAAREDQPPTVQFDEGQLDYGAMPEAFPDLRASGPGGVTGNHVQGGSGFRMVELGSTANASVRPGAMSDYLWSLVPAEMAEHYDGGGTLIVVRNPKPGIERILREKGAIQIKSAPYLA